jgi:hypothetical protein
VLSGTHVPFLIFHACSSVAPLDQVTHKHHSGISQLVRILMVELIYSGLNLRFNLSVIFTANYFSVGVNVPVYSESFLVTDFVNLKIKSAQFFRGAHNGRVYVCVHRNEGS